jgi:hypothetical protein
MRGSEAYLIVGKALRRPRIFFVCGRAAAELEHEVVVCISFITWELEEDTCAVEVNGTLSHEQTMKKSAAPRRAPSP